jgi:DNA-binding protein H-NS
MMESCWLLIQPNAGLTLRQATTGLQMPSLKELTAQRAALDAEIARLQSTARADAIAQVKELMATHGLEPKDLASGTPAPRKKSGSVAAKYRDTASDSTWSGRGLQPKWLRAAIAGGATLDSFKL